jgi:hypothetical protein
MMTEEDWKKLAVMAAQDAQQRQEGKPSGDDLLDELHRLGFEGKVTVREVEKPDDKRTKS